MEASRGFTGDSETVNCLQGFSGGGDVFCQASGSFTTTSCSDIDECTAATDNCDVNAACSNTVGSFTCSCNTGYTGDGTVGNCNQNPFLIGGVPSNGSQLTSLDGDPLVKFSEPLVKGSGDVVLTDQSGAELYRKDINDSSITALLDQDGILSNAIRVTIPTLSPAVPTH